MVGTRGKALVVLSNIGGRGNGAELRFPVAFCTGGIRAVTGERRLVIGGTQKEKQKCQHEQNEARATHSSSAAAGKMSQCDVPPAEVANYIPRPACRPLGSSDVLVVL